MGNNMIPFTFAIGEKYTYFISTHYKLIENDETEEHLHVMKKIVFMLLDNVVINVFVSIVIKIKMILIY